MDNAVDAHLEQKRVQGFSCLRNGSCPRHLLTELGDMGLRIPRTRIFSARPLLKGFARRAFSIERLILLSFLFGPSTRKAGQALLPILGERVSRATFSQIGKQLDRAVQAYHQRPLSDAYEVLLLDGVVMKRTGIGVQKRSTLVALGIKSDGKKQVIDFRQVYGESQSVWEAFLNDLYRRGLEGHGLKLVATDGRKGLQAALPLVYGDVPIQRCCAHKTRNVLNYVKRTDQKKVKKDLQPISHARNLREAHKAAQRFMARGQTSYPKAVQCLLQDLPELLTFLQVNVSLPYSMLRTTNAIERRFREIRRRTRPMRTSSDRTSMDRIMFSVFTYENPKQGTDPHFFC